ncbi:MAG: hypothetical protein L0241_20640 [Planctomycetia bacterium]|nr:hypothetical protein [Planctomycetia bacterium]
MDCQAVQNLILGLPDPRELSPTLRAHVLECQACSAWAKQAARLESLLAQLPVPPAPSEKKEAMLEELTSSGPVITRVPTVRPDHTGVWLDAAGRVLRKNTAYIGGLAAAILLVIGIYWLWPNKQTPPVAEATQDHPLLKNLVAHDIALARASTPAKRFEILGGMADDLAVETRGMARIASADELKRMAGWYQKVVNEGIIQQAKDEANRHMMTDAEKKNVFGALAAKLETDANEAERMMAESPQEAQPALKRMAETAREGHKTLRTLFASLASWVGDQAPSPPPAPLTADDRIRLLKANGQLIDNLVNQSIELSRAGDSENRAIACRKTAQLLAAAAEVAATKQEAERVAVLTRLFHKVVRDGLIPTLGDWKRGVPPESPSALRLAALRNEVPNDVINLKSAIPTSGAVGENPNVRDALAQLDELTDKLMTKE